MGNWTKTPNAVLELLSHFESEGDKVSIVEIKLTLALVRQTFGWRRNKVRMTWEDIDRLTSIKGRASIGKAIEAVERRGFFVHGRKSLWEINSSMFELFAVGANEDISPRELDYCSKFELLDDKNSSMFEPFGDENSSEFELEESSKFEPIPFIEKKKNKEKNPPTPQTADEEAPIREIHDVLMGYIATFEQSTGLKRPRHWEDEKHKHRKLFLDDWFGPVKDMKALANGRTEELMTTAYRELVGRGFSPGSPSGVYKTVVALFNRGSLPAAVSNGHVSANDLIDQAFDEVNAGIGLF